MNTRQADVLIVGGGIIGLTLARELLARGRENVVILEKEPELGRHASGRNSGVLHAGIYYSPDSLKARSCLGGNRLMKAFCREKGLPLLEGGKVIVARTEAELPALEELHRRATANGARGRVRRRAGARSTRADGPDRGQGAPLALHRGRRSEARCCGAPRGAGGHRQGPDRHRLPVPGARGAGRGPDVAGDGRATSGS